MCAYVYICCSSFQVQFVEVYSYTYIVDVLLVYGYYIVTADNYIYIMPYIIFNSYRWSEILLFTRSTERTVIIFSEQLSSCKTSAKQTLSCFLVPRGHTEKRYTALAAKTCHSYNCFHRSWSNFNWLCLAISEKQKKWLRMFIEMYVFPSLWRITYISTLICLCMIVIIFNYCNLILYTIHSQ